jgi:hypothetical protein
VGWGVYLATSGAFNLAIDTFWAVCRNAVAKTSGAM